MPLPHRHLDEALDSAVRSGDVAGVVAGVTGPDAALYEGSFGWADLDRELPMRRDSVFRIASMTKLITSVAVLMLRAEGKVALDDALADHLPRYEQPPVLAHFDKRTRDYETRPAARPVTLRQLLAHTSGYGYWFLSPELRAVAGDDASNFEAPFLLHEPGERFTYGIGADVLGQMFVPVTGWPIESFFADRIFRPLGAELHFVRIAARRAAARGRACARGAGAGGDPGCMRTYQRFEQALYASLDS